jgi:4-hydroxy-tetrahydrodipicolinate synthase
MRVPFILGFFRLTQASVRRVRSVVGLGHVYVYFTMHGMVIVRIAVDIIDDAPMNLPRPLRGIVTPMATPLAGPDTLDRPAVERLVEKLISGGVSGVFVLGTTGEAPGLSYRLRSELVDRVCSVVAGRVPVLVSVTDTSTTETINFAKHSAQAGASGLVLAPPYYFELSQPELLRYLKRLTPELPRPVYLYNIPSLTKTPFAPETVRAAADLTNVYGVKDSSGDLTYFAELIRKLADRPEFAILCGPEELLAQTMAMGAHGGISGGSNLWPELFVGLYKAALNRDTERIAELQAMVAEIGKNVYNLRPEGSSYLRGMKCALSVLGCCRNVMAEPYEPYGQDETEKIRATFRSLGLLDGETRVV